VRLQDRVKKRVITPIFSTEYCKYKSDLTSGLTKKSKKGRTATSACDEASVNRHPMTQGKVS